MRGLERWALGLSLLLASGTFLASAYLYSRVQDLSIQGCERQNRLRSELNETLIHFQIPPRFRLTDCERAWRLYGPAPPPQPYKAP